MSVASDENPWWDRVPSNKLWCVSFGLSLLFATMTLGIWAYIGGKHDDKVGVGITVYNDADVDRAVKKLFPAEFDDGVPIYRIPTGVVLNSLEFVNANNVILTGSVWQRFRPGLPADLVRGVQFEEADDQHAAKPSLSYRVGDQDVRVWSFRITVRQRFDYTRYPLDKQDVWLRMHTADGAHRVQLVPDFLVYPDWDVEKLLGLDPEFVRGQWQPYSTTFSMHKVAPALRMSQPITETADLYYNIGVSRGLIGPLVSRLVPVSLLALLVFLALFVTTIDNDRRSLSGFTAFAIIGFAVSTVLVVAVNDNAVRTETGMAGVNYLEYWYFILYLLTLMVALNAILVVSGRWQRLVHWRENLLPRLVYWPLFTGLMFIATVGTFSS